MGVTEGCESRVIEIRTVNPGKDGFFDPSIAWERLSHALMMGGRPALDDLLQKIDWLRSRVNQCYVNRPVDPAADVR